MNMINPSSRPGTLAEVIQRFRNSDQDLASAISEFLDEFYLDFDKTSQKKRIEMDPGLIGDPKQDAWIGAIGEHLTTRWQLGFPPEWTENPERFLKRPWFTCGNRTKPFNFVESPSAFRRRFIFTEIEPLRRARMPQDSRWWANETLRTGIELPDKAEYRPSMSM